MGQFETPADVADLLLGFCLRRPSDRLLDPSCGTGAFLQRAARWQRWLADIPSQIPPGSLWGVELDPAAAELARDALPQAHILTQNFFTLDPNAQPPFDAIIGNPPYTRAGWIGRLQTGSAQQLALFDLPGEPGAPDNSPLIPAHLSRRLSGRAGLHAYFFLHGLGCLRQGGRFGFVVPNGWLDVAYGEGLKQFLLDHFKVIALIESQVERWFNDARVNTCLVVLEVCRDADQRARNLVRLVRLQRPLRDLIPTPPDDYRRPQAVEQLVSRLMPATSRQTVEAVVRVLPQAALGAATKWGVALRAPAVYQQRLDQNTLPPLKKWATAQRGFTTGANSFFYLDEATIEQWGIEAEFRRPLLKSLRGRDQLRLHEAACSHQVLWLPPAADLRQTAIAHYVAWGEAEGYHQRPTCAARQPWYSLPRHQAESPAALILPKGIWQRHFAPLLAGQLLLDQQLYQIRLAEGVAPLVAAALFNSAWFALQCELQGRVNFGEGVLWLAAYEIEAMQLPDPRHLPAAEAVALADLFTRLAQRPLQDLETELSQPDRQALDAAVFDLMGFTASERSSVLDTLLERAQTRRALSTATTNENP